MVLSTARDDSYVVCAYVRVGGSGARKKKKNGQTNKQKGEKKTEKKKSMCALVQRERALEGVYVTVKHKRNGREHEKQNKSFEKKKNNKNRGSTHIYNNKHNEAKGRFESRKRKREKACGRCC